MNIKYVALFMFSVILLGCKNNKSTEEKNDSKALTNEIAMEFLKNNFSQNCYQKLSGGRYQYNGSYEQRIDTYQNSYAQQIMTDLQDLQNNGFVRSIEKRKNHIKFNLTSKANEFKKTNSKNEYLIAKSEVTEIIGIANNENSGTAIVRFKYKLIPTDLHKIRIYYKNQNKDNCKLKEYESELEFIKFDTGWQIKK